MTHSIRTFLGVALVALGVCACTPKKHYPIDVDPKKHLAGKTYELTRDCYVFTWRNYKPPFPVFTAYPPAKGVGLPELPKNVSGDFIGQKFVENNEITSEAYEIVGTIKKGTRFQVVRVYAVSPEDNRFNIYQVSVLDPYQPAFPELDAFWITDHRSGRPKDPEEFAPEFAREIK